MFVTVKDDERGLLLQSQNSVLKYRNVRKVLIVASFTSYTCRIALPRSTLSSNCDRHDKSGTVALFLPRELLGGYNEKYHLRLEHNIANNNHT